MYILSCCDTDPTLSDWHPKASIGWGHMKARTDDERSVPKHMLVETHSSPSDTGSQLYKTM
jgi:hypothetical protein